MITLARVVVDHEHAVQRDLLCHQYRWEEFGMPEDRLLSFPRFVAFVFGAPPTSALGQAVTEGWSHTDELLANLAEQHAGLIQLTGRYKRPGVKIDTKAAAKAADDDTEQQAQQEEQDHTSAAAARLGVSSGGKFDTFDNPADFHARLAAARGETRAEASA